MYIFSDLTFTYINKIRMFITLAFVQNKINIYFSNNECMLFPLIILIIIVVTTRKRMKCAFIIYSPVISILKHFLCSPNVFAV